MGTFWSSLRQGLYVLGTVNCKEHGPTQRYQGSYGVEVKVFMG